MKIHGYADQGLPLDQIVPDELAEITLVASPVELRAIARFFVAAANEMETNKEFDHLHLSDRLPEFKSSPHLVVFNSQNAD